MAPGGCVVHTELLPSTSTTMASGLAKKAGLKVLEKHLESYTPQDPLYEEYTDEKGKKKRRKVRIFRS